VSHRWLILLRVCGDETDGRRDSNSGTATCGIAWRLVDDHGRLPNGEETRKLTEEALRRFHQRWSYNATRVTLARVPWFPADGEHPTWREPLGKGDDR
jgi:hypothetical protein